MMNPKFSIIIPVYNVDRYIEDCLKSIVAQSYVNYEIIIVDDSSTDSSLTLCQKIQSERGSIRILTQLNAGPNSARNLAIDHAKGDFLVFVDSDDRVEPNMLESLSEIISAQSPDIVNYGFDFFDEKSGSIIKQSHFPEVVLEGRDAFLCALEGKVIVGVCWNKCIKRQLVMDNHIRFVPDRKHGRDILFTRQCANSARKVVITNKIFYHSRFRVGSYSRNFGYSNIESALDLSEKHFTAFLHDHSDESGQYLEYAVGRHMRYILTLSAFRSASYKDFLEGMSAVRRSDYWKYVIGKNLGLTKVKDRILAYLLNRPRLCWFVVRSLKKINYQPY